MEYLVIEFTRAQGKLLLTYEICPRRRPALTMGPDKKLFLEKAKFHGIPDAEMLAPLTF
jgi:hypothetical protein